MTPLISLLPLLVAGVDKVPADDDVKAGWVAFGVFIALAVAVALLGWSLTRHLRRARTNADAGVFDPSDGPRVSPRRRA
ncbi:MAG: hypothetical protein JWR90_2752 [Marmoricola sp.]|jgi:hypothetical protein|nr:hypothetical protein [Marmoricola sp.]